MSTDLHREETNDEARLKLLIFDDDEDDIFLIKTLLEKNMQHENPMIFSAQNMQEALDICYMDKIDLCLLDYRLGKRDGIRAFNELRESGFIFPVIMLTGAGDEKVAVSAMKTGAADYYSKGNLNATDLVKSIRSAVRTHKSLETIEGLLDI